MRDIILATFIVGMLPVILRRPVFGALMWAWVSMMNPHTLTYGFALRVPWALIIAIATLVAFAISKERKPLPMNGGTLLIILLLAWMTVTSLFALNPIEGEVLDRWIFVLKIFFMLLITFMLVRGRKEIDWLVWVMVVSVGFYGVKGGLWTLATGGGGRVWGPPGGNLAGNNELAVGLVILLPWMYYLREVSTNRWVRRGLMVSMVAVVFGILGSQSRGALLAVLAMAMVMGAKGKHMMRTMLGLAVVGVAALAFMPDSWTSRMDTIQTYEADTSAMSRIWTWKTLWNAAVDRPLLGAGFRADNQFVFNKYAPYEAVVALKGAVFVAHSIYFQALGEHGFVGLGIYLLLGLWTWFGAGRLARLTADDPEFSPWVPLLMRMTQVSLIGFGIGGAFLSLMLLDLTYYIPGVVVLTHATVHERLRQRRALPVPGPMAPPTEGEKKHAVLHSSRSA
jgi:probable O-glycosylation ligase (exosortase A-associated)